ncbi:MAG: SDR family oxidoreductase [Clostridia bacterium]|nr:SDR family oxidoreductase [Oscillospiraceae bacterium]MBQ7960196.1 SDR family oxidoreductase [Clostridia bacterium]
MKTVLITGASRGIGRETARLFGEKGWRVAVNYNKSKAKAESLCEEIRSYGGTAEAFCADVSDEAQTEKMIDEILARFGTIDVLVNNAGIALKQGLFTDFSAEDARMIFDTNVFGMMNCSRNVIPHMVHRKSGKIVNVSSIWGICGASCEVIYSSAKAAVIGFSKALAKELAPSGICVNCVAPGMIDTDMNGHLSNEDVDDLCTEIPLGRIGKAEEVAESIFFLAAESSSYITGQIITVDGGWM